MKQNRVLLVGTLCLISVIFLITGKNCLAKSPVREKTEISGGNGQETKKEMSACVKAYTDFLLEEDISQGHDFPIRGYYLFDLNFDGIPELGILHDSWGSMGGYFTCYYYDGEQIAEILDERGEPARISSFTQILADFDKQKVYLLKEMYLLQGNINGTYGYVREIRWEENVPCVYYILDLEVDGQKGVGEMPRIQHKCEDEFLADPVLEDWLVARCYREKESITISPDTYLKRKRKLIPVKNAFVDLRRVDLNYLGELDFDEDGFPADVRIEKEEITRLFDRFAQSLEASVGKILPHSL